MAEMKNNMQYWKKVKTQVVESEYSRYINIDFTLPITCQNLLIEFITGYTAKVHNNRDRGDRPDRPDRQQKKEKKAAKIESVS